MTVTLGLSNNRGTLRVSSNPRYLTDNSGKAIMLFGFHTWANIQDRGESDPPPVFDWDDYIDQLVSYSCNYTKLWVNEAQEWADPLAQGFPAETCYPTLYERTGPGDANDGGLKYDLTRINSTYLARLRARAVDCAANGIYCAVQLFQGWQIESKGGAVYPFLNHPYHSANNINSVDGDANDDDEGTEIHTDSSNNVLAYQEDFVEAVIDLLNDLDNIFWEISNEDTGSQNNTDWQEYMIAHIAAYEATKPKQHLIMRTVCYPSGSDAALDASAAELVCYGPGKADDVLDGDKVAFRDSDHVEGIATDYDWLWPAALNGSAGVHYMDLWDAVIYEQGDTREDPDYMVIRANLGYAKTLYAMLNNLLLMTPQAALSTSGYCLARDHTTAGEYVAYYDGSSTFNLDLTNATGTLNVRWLRCSDGTVQDSATVSGGAVRTFTPPWTGRVVAYVRHT